MLPKDRVGGRKKGLIPGLGTGGDIFYKKPSSRADKSSSVYTPSLLSQLSTRMEQSQQLLVEQRVELERQRSEWEKERFEVEKVRQEESRKFNEYLVEMRKAMQDYSQMFSQCGGSFPFSQPHDPRDPSGGGTPGPCAG